MVLTHSCAEHMPPRACTWLGADKHACILYIRIQNTHAHTLHTLINIYAIDTMCAKYMRMHANTRYGGNIAKEYMKKKVFSAPDAQRNHL